MRPNQTRCRLMNKKIPARRKWVMATGLTLVFLPLGVYVNSDDLRAAALMQRLFPDLTIQFVVSTAINCDQIRPVNKEAHKNEQLFNSNTESA